MTSAKEIDFAAINQAALASYPDRLSVWFPNGRLKGREFEIGNLAGDSGVSLKINTETGIWTDFATGESGSDPVSLRAAQLRIGQADAAKSIAREFGLNFPGRKASRASGKATSGDRPNSRPAKTENWVPLRPQRQPPSTIRHPTLGTPDHIYHYHHADRDLAFVVCRWEARGKSGKKVLPYSYGILNGHEAWQFKHPAPARPPYNVLEIVSRSEAPILVVEGEKAAEAARRLVGDTFVVTTWCGGTPAVRKTDWSCLAGRTVILWPDNDEPGCKAAAELSTILGNVGTANVEIVAPPSNTPRGWDLADAENERWDASAIARHIRTNKTSAAIQPNAGLPPPDESYPEPGDFFRFLGYEHEHFYFLTARGQQVIGVAGHRLRDRGTLIMLAPLAFWEQAFPGSRGIDVDRIADWLIRKSFDAKIYDPVRLRGRGAWWDDGRAILHLGDRLLVDGQSVSISDFDSRFIYEASQALPYAEVDPLSDRDAAELQQICDMLLWERPSSGLLLAGWCVVALVAGALRWRPHIWITSSSGSGKSWIMDQIIWRAVGDFALPVQSKTTEAGLRQEIKGDARPILFDEAEGEDLRARDRMQAVVEFARACSSENGGDLLKGTPSGIGMRYRARCCFAFGSINVQLRRMADENRVTVLSLLSPTKDRDPEAHQKNMEHFKRLQARVEELLTGDFSSRLLMRTVRCLPTMIKNVETYSNAITDRLGNRRLGDQIGTLLAGAHVLGPADLITPDNARTFIDTLGLSNFMPPPDQQDEQRLLSRLLEHIVRVSNENGFTTERSIGELVTIACGTADTTVFSAAADSQLKRLGFRVDRDTNFLFVSNTNSKIAQILFDTPWATDWSRTLKRIPESMSPKNPIRFMKSSKDRAVGIPLSTIMKNDE